MRSLTLRSWLMLVVIAALLPIGTLSIVQALASLNYSQTLIGNQLIANALATAGRERDPIIIAQHTLVTLSANKAVRTVGPACREGLRAGLLGNPALLNFARSDKSGQVRCSVLPFDAPLSFADNHWWQRGIKTKKFTLSAPVIGDISKRNVLVGMLPLTAPDGTNDGAITVAVDMAWLKKSLATANKSADATIAVADARGQIVLASGNAKLPKLLAAPAIGRLAEADSEDGQTWMYSAAPLYEDALYIIYAEPKDVVMATALKQVRIDMILPIVTVLLASLALWIGTNAIILRWLNSLRDLTIQFARGDYRGDTESYARAPREIREFSDDLHTMANTIAARNDDLQNALTAKTNLTLEIHHRVKNNLQIVSSLLNLQARRIADPSARAALNQTRARIGALAQIHRLLYEEHNDSEHGHVDIGLLMRELCTQLRALHRHQSNVELVCTAGSHTLPVDNAVPLSLLAVEAITNGICHAFPEGHKGTVTLSFDVEEGEATLRVIDDGAGYDTNGQNKSMGHQLMEAFAHQLDGTLEIQSSPGAGTTVTLRYRPSENNLTK